MNQMEKDKPMNQDSMENDKPKNRDTMKSTKPKNKVIKKKLKKKLKHLHNEKGNGKPYSRNLNHTKITNTQLDDIKSFLKRQEKITGRSLEDLLAQTLSRDQVKSEL